MATAAGVTTERRLLIPLSSLLSAQERPRRGKVDGSGAILPFEGVTIIMPAVDATSFDSMYQRAHDCIARHTAEVHQAPLTGSSMHVTLASVITRLDCPTLDEYNEFVTEHHAAFEQVKWVYAHSTRRIRFTAWVGSHPTHLGLGLQPKTREDAEELRQLVRLTKSALGSAWPREPQFHLSLSYPIPSSPKPSAESWQQLKEELRVIFEEQDIVVDAPVVCVSLSMLAFQPV